MELTLWWGGGLVTKRTRKTGNEVGSEGRARSGEGHGDQRGNPEWKGRGADVTSAPGPGRGWCGCSRVTGGEAGDEV